MCPKANFHPHRPNLLPCLGLLNDQATYRLAAYLQSDSYSFIHQPEDKEEFSLASNYACWNCQGATNSRWTEGLGFRKNPKLLVNSNG